MDSQQRTETNAAIRFKIQVARIGGHPTSRNAPSVFALPPVLREVRAMDTQEIKIEEALEIYYRAAKEYNSLFGGLVPYEVVRDLFCQFY